MTELWEHDWEEAQESIVYLDGAGDLMVLFKNPGNLLNQEPHVRVKLERYYHILRDKKGISPSFRYFMIEMGTEEDEETELLLIPLLPFGEAAEENDYNQARRHYEIHNKLYTINPLNNFAFSYDIYKSRFSFGSLYNYEYSGDEDLSKMRGGCYLAVPRCQNMILSLYDQDEKLIDQTVGVSIIWLQDDLGQYSLDLQYRDRDYQFDFPSKYGDEISLPRQVRYEDFFEGNIETWKNYGLFGQPLLPMVNIERTGLYNPPFVTPKINYGEECFQLVNKLSENLKEDFLTRRLKAEAEGYTSINLVDYAATVQDNILSMFVALHPWGLTNSRIINYDLLTGDFASDEIMLERINRHLERYGISLDMPDLKVAIEQSFDYNISGGWIGNLSYSFFPIVYFSDLFEGEEKDKPVQYLADYILPLRPGNMEDNRNMIFFGSDGRIHHNLDGEDILALYFDLGVISFDSSSLEEKILVHLQGFLKRLDTNFGEGRIREILDGYHMINETIYISLPETTGSKKYKVYLIIPRDNRAFLSGSRYILTSLALDEDDPTYEYNLYLYRPHHKDLSFKMKAENIPDSFMDVSQCFPELGVIK